MASKAFEDGVRDGMADNHDNKPSSSDIFATIIDMVSGGSLDGGSPSDEQKTEKGRL